MRYYFDSADELAKFQRTYSSYYTSDKPDDIFDKDDYRIIDLFHYAYMDGMMPIEESRGEIVVNQCVVFSYFVLISILFTIFTVR